MSSGRAPRGDTSDGQGPLPPGWKTKINRDIDPPRRMYYNRSTGKTSWQRPAVPGAAPGSVAKAPVAASAAAAAVAVSEPPGASPAADAPPAVPPYTPSETAAATAVGVRKRSEDDVILTPEPASASAQQDDAATSPVVERIEYAPAGCLSKCCCVLFTIFGLLSTGVCIVMVSVMVTFEGERSLTKYYFMLACFFAVLTFFSVVMCITLLVPRYTGTTGIKCMRWKHHAELLTEESWVWSMKLRGSIFMQLFKVTMAIYFAMVKFAQLFALTYDPATIDELPDIYVEIGDVVLLDIERLISTEESNATIVAGLSSAEGFVGNNLGLEVNISQSSFVTDANQAMFTALQYAGGPDAYRNKFFGYSALCVFTLMLVALGWCFGCLEGRRGENCEMFFIGVLGTIVEFVFIPLYHHLLSALSCSEVTLSQRDGVNNITSIQKVWLWDVDTSVRCFEGDVWDFDIKSPPHLVFFFAAMLAICLMQWPAAFFLMVRPDTWSDHKRWHIWELIRKEDKWKQEMQHHGINMHHELQKGSSEFRQFSTRFKLPALKLRETAKEVYKVEHAKIVEVDTQGCCSGELDSQADGISSIQRRPREAPIAFMLEVTIATVSMLMRTDGLMNEGKEFNELVYDQDKLKLKLLAICVIFVLLALFYCNPLALLCGQRKCSPFKDSAGTDHRTSMWQMGYPYNWEPLNFFRSYLMIICGSFALFQLLSFNHKKPIGWGANGPKVAPDKAMLYWMYSCIGFAVFYGLALLVRWRVFCRDSSKTKTRREGIARP